MKHMHEGMSITFLGVFLPMKSKHVFQEWCSAQFEFFPILFPFLAITTQSNYGRIMIGEKTRKR